MKNFNSLLTFAAFLIVASCFAQGVNNGLNSKFTQMATGMHEDLEIVAYHVEERINMPFGGRITTYEVSSLALVSKTDLGPNNSRKVTPKFAKSRTRDKAESVALAHASVSGSQISLKTSDVVFNKFPQAEVVASVEPQMPVVEVVAPAEPVKPEPAVVAEAPKDEKKYAYIDVVATYERVLEKGYRTIDMVQRVAERAYFDGDLKKAARWYTELLTMTSDLPTEFYYRYAQALKSIKEVDKALEMMRIFEKMRQDGK